MIINQIIFHFCKHTELFFLTEGITGVILFVIGSTVGNAIAMGLS